MKEYFYKKEYKYLYISKFLYFFSNSLMEVFGTVMLYKAGIPIWLILLIYGFRFGITGFITPLFITLSNKLGIAKCMLISNIFSIIGTYLMLDSTSLNRNIIIFIFIMGLMGLSNPAPDSLSSKYVETEHRGRYNSLLIISKILGGILASGLISWGVLTNHNMILFIFMAICYLLEYVLIRRIDYKPENKNNAFKSTMKYITKSKSKYKVIYALRASHIIERQFIPLYLFIAIQDFKLFSSIIAVSLVLQIITILLIGKYSDKSISKANNLVTVIKAILSGIFIFAKSKVAIGLNKTLCDNFERVYETSIQTSIQNIIKESKEDNELLSAIGQMSLCLAEIIIFSILALISYYIGEKIFIIIFILSIISTILIDLNIKRENENLV